MPRWKRRLDRGAGLDGHKNTVAVCVQVPGAHGDRVQSVRTVDTTTAALLGPRDWLAAHGVPHIAMERTGVYLATRRTSPPAS